MEHWADLSLFLFAPALWIHLILQFLCNSTLRFSLCLNSPYLSQVTLYFFFPSTSVVSNYSFARWNYLNSTHNRTKLELLWPLKQMIAILMQVDPDRLSPHWNDFVFVPCLCLAQSPDVSIQKLLPGAIYLNQIDFGDMSS